MDLVETGTTMRAAGLEIVGEVMTTQTVLIANKRSSKRGLMSRIHKRIKGYMLAKASVLLSFNIKVNKKDAAVLIAKGESDAGMATVQSLRDPSWCAVSVLVKASHVANIMDQLQGVGATALIVSEIKNCRV